MTTPDIVCFPITNGLYCLIPQCASALAWALANSMDQGEKSEPIRFIGFKNSMDADITQMRSSGYTVLVTEKPDWLEVEEVDDE